jgi:acetyltransferase-like isoleucine patch superfamily enzyme
MGVTDQLGSRVGSSFASRFSSMGALSGAVTQFRDSSHARYSVANSILALTPPFVSGYVRGILYRWAGLEVDRTAFIMGNVRLIGGTKAHVANVRIGSKVTMSTNITINCDGPVDIGENVTIGPFVKLYTTSHELGPGSRRCQVEVVARPIVIEKGSWIAVGAIILPGVTIGQGSVVAAGSVVDRDVPPDSYVQGVPAVVVRKLPLGNR